MTYLPAIAALLPQRWAVATTDTFTALDSAAYNVLALDLYRAIASHAIVSSHEARGGHSPRTLAVWAVVEVVPEYGNESAEQVFAIAVETLTNSKRDRRSYGTGEGLSTWVANNFREISLRAGEGRDFLEAQGTTVEDVAQAAIAANKAREEAFWAPVPAPAPVVEEAPALDAKAALDTLINEAITGRSLVVMGDDTFAVLCVLDHALIALNAGDTDTALDSLFQVTVADEALLAAAFGESARQTFHEVRAALVGSQSAQV